MRNAYQQMDGSFGGGALAPEPRPVAPQQAPAGPRIVEPHEFLFDANLVRDHRVRAQVRLDLQDLVRAEANEDLRLSLVHLGSLLEGLLLDHGLRNRKELALGEGPDLWDFHALAIQVFGQAMKPEQEPVLGILHACRRLLRPSCQVVHPIVTTAKMVHEAKNFLLWALGHLGFTTDETKPRDLDDSASSLWRVTNNRM